MRSRSTIPVETQEKPGAVCGRETAYRTIYEKWGYPIHKCACCGLGSTGNAARFRPEEFNRESYFQGGQKDGYADYVGSEAVLRAEFHRALGHLRSHACKEGKLLEIGCAFGYFLTEAQKYFQCTGIEISDAAAAACRARGLEVRRATEPLARAIEAVSGRFAALAQGGSMDHSLYSAADVQG